MKVSYIHRFLLSLIITAFALGNQVVKADEIVIDFDDGTYSAGEVDGQNGWSGPPTAEPYPYDHEIVDNSQTTDYDYPTFGQYSLRVSNAFAHSLFPQTHTPPLADEAGETEAENGGMSGGNRQACFQAEWDFASTVPDAEQPDLNMYASPDRGDGARMSRVQMVDRSDGLAIGFRDFQRGSNFVSTDVVTGLDRSVPHRIKLVVQFFDGPTEDTDPENDIVRLYVDGALMHEGTTWENYFRDGENNPPRTVDSILFHNVTTNSTRIDSLRGHGFLIDNVLVYSGPLPENLDGDCFAVNPPPSNGGGDDDDDDTGSSPSTPAQPGQPALTFDCSDLGAQTSGAMTASGTVGNVAANGVYGNTYCHVITLNGSYITNPGEIGNVDIINQNVVQAVDLFGLLPGGVGVKPFVSPVGLCLAGTGAVYFLNAEDRAVSQLPASSSGGSTCVSVPASGTVVLVGSYTGGSTSASVAPASATGASTPLTDCQVTTEYILRLRANANTSSPILDRLPMGTTVNASETRDGWFKVVFGDQEGWVSGDFVSTSANCG